MSKKPPNCEVKYYGLLAMSKRPPNCEVKYYGLLAVGFLKDLVAGGLGSL